MNIKILVATHKQYWMPEDSVYMPIHVGREGKADIGYTGDHTGDNISSKNANYCEEQNVSFMEPQNWLKKGSSFVLRKFGLQSKG